MAHGTDTSALYNLIQQAERSGILDISALQINSLPELPDNINMISIYGTQITTLPKLPSQLKKLECTFMKKLTSIPELPEGLLELECDLLNALNSIPKLPNGLEKLKLTNTSVSVLPELPTSLYYLNLAGSKVSMLPELPPKLQFLSLTGTDVEVLPELPSSLKTLQGVSNRPLLIQMKPNESIKDYNLRWRKWRIENAELNQQKRHNIGKALEQKGVPSGPGTGPLKNILGFAGIPAPAKGTGRRKRKFRKTRRRGLKRK